jgi:CspA family cold shock protein
MERGGDATVAAWRMARTTVRRDHGTRRPKVTGKIRTLRVDKGFGFIKDDTGKEYFFHQSAIYGEGLENLREGDSVEFDIGEGPKGPRAENVRRTST